MRQPVTEASPQICERCGRVFKAKRARFCGNTCRAGSARRSLPAASRAAVRWAASPTHQDHICRHCGDAFRPKHAGRTSFCGRACAFAYRRRPAGSAEP